MRTLFARIAFDNHRATALALMTNNDVLQTKFIGTILYDVPRTLLSDTFINISFDTIDGMWTSTGGGWSEPVKSMRIVGQIIDENVDEIIVKCDEPSELGRGSFDRISLTLTNHCALVFDSTPLTKLLLGNIPIVSLREDIATGPYTASLFQLDDGTAMAVIGEQVIVIRDLPREFVQHWVWMNAKAIVQNDTIMIVKTIRPRISSA